MVINFSKSREQECQGLQANSAWWAGRLCQTCTWSSAQFKSMKVKSAMLHDNIHHSLSFVMV